MAAGASRQGARPWRPALNKDGAKGALGAGSPAGGEGALMGEGAPGPPRGARLVQDLPGKGGISGGGFGEGLYGAAQHSWRGCIPFWAQKGRKRTKSGAVAAGNGQD